MSENCDWIRRVVDDSQLSPQVVSQRRLLSYWFVSADKAEL